jgi:hypothetical protein
MFFVWELFCVCIYVNVITICALGSKEANRNKGKMSFKGVV